MLAIFIFSKPKIHLREVHFNMNYIKNHLNPMLSKFIDDQIIKVKFSDELDAFEFHFEKVVVSVPIVEGMSLEPKTFVFKIIDRYRQFQNAGAQTYR